MVQLWLGTLVLFLVLLLGIVVFLYSFRLSVNSEDSHVIDPLPEDSEKPDDK